jgi:hypothetical protein
VTHIGTTIEIEGPDLVIPRVIVAVVNHGIIPDNLRIKRPSLEDVFLNITGHGIEE